MRSTIRMFLVLLALTFTHSFAQANEIEDQNQEVLADILSPDELLEEMGDTGLEEQSAADILSSVRMADQNCRLQIRVDKARQGTSPTAQTMEIYLDGNLIHTLPVSTGREKDELAKSGRKYFSSTPKGTFKIIRRSRKHFSVTWQAPMPYAQFFNGGIAIHATSRDHYQELGTRASGGCVRVTYDDAKMIWNLVDEVGVSETRITVYDGSRQ